MDNNFKLRRAIIIATMIMGGSYSLTSNAIGLGDMNVRSYLGQPLVADLQVYGVSQRDDATCFHVKNDDTNTIHHVNFSLNRMADGNAKLNIKSPKPVIEPIASLTIMNTCGTLFTRQYNLLIDPAPTTMAGNQFGLVTQSNNDANANTVTSAVLPETVSNKAKTKRSTRKATKASTANKKVTRVAKKKTSKRAVAKKAKSVITTKPLLTISGGNLIQANDHSMQLNLDKSIDPNRPTVPVAFLDTDFADELTVMQNRVSHLDKQLSKISIQNSQLKANNKAQQQALSDANQTSDFWRIIAFCLGGALLASSYFFVDWLRRRNDKLKAEKEDALWHAMQKEQEEAEAKQTFEIDETFKPDFNATQIEFIEPELVAEQEPKAKKATKSIMDKEKSTAKTDKIAKVKKEDTEKNIAANNIYQIQNSTDIIEEDTEVIEDAELFVSHGRVNLAIQVLQSHLLEQPKEAASTWMYLLDLLAKEGMEEEYKIAAKECNKHFNISVAAFSESKTDTSNNTLESFERISAELQKRWGTPEAVTFLDELIYNTRVEPRVGFSKEIFEELNLLREIAQDEIRLDDPQDDSKEESSKEKTTLDLPEVEVSDEFKTFGKKVKEENRKEKEKKEAEDDDDEGFEFELMDIGHR